MSVTLHIAMTYADAGLSVFPLRTKRMPAVAWKKFKLHSEPPSESQLRRWFGDDGQPGIAVVNGEASGGLFCRDFDSLDAYASWKASHGMLASTLPTVATPREGGGRHVYAR